MTKRKLISWVCKALTITILQLSNNSVLTQKVLHDFIHHDTQTSEN